MPLLLGFVLLTLVVIVLIPVSLVQRFRLGTRRRPARRWVATANLIAVSVSAVLFLAGAVAATVWVPDAYRYTLAGLGAGAVAGLVGLVLTRWETLDGRLHYTPNRLLVLAITLVVAARVLYGFWRAWDAWQAGESATWLAASGAAATMSAGAVVLGYYAVFWAGVRRRVSPSSASRRAR